jgi:PAS domain S-box-containing protein
MNLVKILFIEDNEDDFALMLREIKKASFKIDYVLIDNAKSLEVELKKEWDIIISDYSLPGFNGYEALRILNRKGIDIPFIVVSGTVGEDIAVDMMKSGAKDYLMKKDLARLIPAIERELTDAKIRKRNKLIALERETLFAISRDMISTDNLDELLEKIYHNIRKVIYAENFFIALHNDVTDELSFPFFRDLFDSKPEPMKNRKSLTDLVLRKEMTLLVNKDEFKKFEIEYALESIGTDSESWLGVPLIIKKKPIGVLVVQSYDKNVIYNEYDKSLLEAIATDIALAIERKRAEEDLRQSEDRYRVFINSSSDLAFLKDDKLNYLLVNKANADFFNKNIDDIIGKSDFDLMPEEFANKCRESDLKALKSDSVEANEEIVFGRIFETHKFRVPLSDGKIGLGGYIRDITERKKAEDNLIESRKRLQEAQRIGKIGNWEWFPKENKVIWSDEMYEIFGLEKSKEITTEESIKAFHPDDRDHIIESTRLALEEKKIKKIECRLLRPDGEVRYVYGSGEIDLDDNGNIVKMFGIYQDITERKLYEESLRKSEERFQLAAKASNDVIYDWDLSIKEGWFSDNYKKVFGFSNTRVKFDVWKKNIHPDDVENAVALTDSIIFKGGTNWTCEYRFKRANGSYAYVIDRGFVIRDNKGLPARLIGSIIDFTERKWAEENLRKSEEHYRTLLNAIPDMMFRLDGNGRFIDFHAENESILFTSPEKFLGKNYKEILPPDVSEKLEKTIKKIKKTGEIGIFNYQMPLINNEVDFYEARITCYSNEYVAIIRNITDKMKSEKALAESEEKHRILIESMNEGIIRSDKNDIIMFVNNRTCKIFGYKPEELIGKAGHEFLTVEEDRHIIAEKTKLRLNSVSDSYEIRGRKKSGEIIWLSINGSPIKNDKGEVVGTVAIINDITKNKETELAVKESEQRFRKIFEDSPYGIAMVNSDYRFIRINSQFRKMMGYSEKEICNLTFKDITHPEHLENDIFNIEKLIKGEIKNYNTEKRYIRKDKQIIWGEINISVMRDNNGNFLYFLAMIEDITSRKLAEEAVKESEEHFRQIVKNAEAAYFRIDANGNYEEVNNSWLKIHKFTYPDEIIGKHFRFTQVDSDIEKAHSIVKELLKGKPIETGEFSRRCKDGSIGYHTYSINPVLTKGKITGIEGFLIDITDQKLALEELKASRERYQTLIETMNEGLILVDNNDIIQFVNKRECEIFGYEPEEMIGRVGYKMMIAEEDRHIIIEKNRDRQDLKSDSYEIRAIRKNGEKIWININGAPVKDKNGKVIGSVGLILDITEKKNTEENLMKLSRAVQQSPASIVITDLNGDIEYVNPKFVEITGYLPEEVVGKNPRILKSGLKPPEDYKILWDTITSGNDWYGEFQNKRKNGMIFWESASISPIRNSEGVITHYLAVKEDITEKKEKELELIKAKEKAEESERLKSSFLANMSHELRTPMVGILGFSELIKNIADNNELKDFADNISKSGKRLLETLNLILDLSRIEAGRVEVKTGEVNIVKLTKEVYTNYTSEAEKKKIKYSFVCPYESVISKIDERMIFESINNLVNNAFKYTKSGEIKIIIRPDTKNNIVNIKVKDTGIGIAKENIDVIFEEFRQVSEGYSRSFEGTGLGLTITKNFIEKNGGKLVVESEIGIGTVFTIILPLVDITEIPDKDNNIPENETPTETNKSAFVLCVDDDSFTREYLEYILKGKYNLAFADNGINALETAKIKKYNLILMDINLGKGMDGVETTRKLRKLPGYEKIPIIAMTAFAMVGDKEEFIANGMSDYISKPFKSAELIALVEKTLKKFQ